MTSSKQRSSLNVFGGTRSCPKHRGRTSKISFLQARVGTRGKDRQYLCLHQSQSPVHISHQSISEQPLFTPHHRVQGYSRLIKHRLHLNPSQYTRHMEWTRQTVTSVASFGSQLQPQQQHKLLGCPTAVPWEPRLVTMEPPSHLGRLRCLPHLPLHVLQWSLHHS